MPFLTTLARALIGVHDQDPMRLAAAQILLPTRRACRALADATLALPGGRVVLLPQLTPLGALDLEDLALTGVAPDLLDVSPPIAPLERQLTLARLLMAAPAATGAVTLPPDRAVRLAGALGALLDDLITEGVSLDRLPDLAPPELAAHWQITVDFLSVLGSVWPAVLAERGRQEPAAFRDAVLDAATRGWRATPPETQVIVAGVTGGIPSVTRLVACVASLPTGTVVLPGLDRDLDRASWEALDPSHPQWGLKRLLAALGRTREEVLPWPGVEPRAGRARLWREALRPGATSDGWLAAAPFEAVDTRDLELIVCATQQEEADLIALRMRESLEHPGRNVALITPDRTLARRVAASLSRWGLRIDDSGGQPLASTLAGSFLLLLARACREGLAPIALLALLKHPSFGGTGEDRRAVRRLVRRLDRDHLRGPRPAPGAATITARLSDGQGRRPDPDLMALWHWAAAILDPLVADLTGPPLPLPRLLARHVDAAERLAAGPAAASGPEPGAPDGETPRPSGRLWTREDGEALANFVDELREAATDSDFPPLAGGAYVAVLDALLRTAAVRPLYGTHPRLAVWGLLEARLQGPDLVILGGLNEGAWPADPPADPFLSRAMRAALGLPPPDAEIGEAAHDFVSLATLPRVVMTRSRRVEGAPSVPSRWLARLEVALAAAETNRPRPPGQPAPAAETLAATRLSDPLRPWRDWVRRLDEPDDLRPAARPAPRPPLASRPRQLSVTEIETWMRDPYALYARRILDLAPLDPLDEEIGRSQRGVVIHQALADFIRTCPDGALPADAAQRLREAGRAAFASLAETPEVAAFWWPRFERIAAWVLEEEARLRADRPGRREVEVKGRLELPWVDGPFVLTARADRLDIVDGTAVVLDYKTGSVPEAQVRGDLAYLQLPLEAAILAAGGFSGLPALTPAGLEIWQLKGGEPPGSRLPLKVDATDLARRALERLTLMLAAFGRMETPYQARPRPELLTHGSDYDRLSRFAEWGGR